MWKSNLSVQFRVTYLESLHDNFLDDMVVVAAVVKIFGNSAKNAWNEGNQELGAMCTHIKGVIVRH